MSRPDVALLISTFQRPANLRRTLRAVAAQRGMEGRFEVVVTDDGSTDETPSLVEAFGREVDFPVRFTTHPHDGFRLARCRNEGIAASSAPYLIFLDGDCLIAPDHVRRHWEHRVTGVARAGHCVWMSREVSERITEDAAASGEYVRWLPAVYRWAEAKALLKSHLYVWLRHPRKPKLLGANIAVSRADCERVNGYDERFLGWGGEDDDFRLRLGRAGVRIRTTLPWSRVFHLWHPPAASRPVSWREGANVELLEREFRLTRCVNGLRKRQWKEVAFRTVGRPERWREAQAMMGLSEAAAGGGRGEERNGAERAEAEVEVLFWPGDGRFSGRADCNVLVVLEEAPEASREARRAHLIVADRPVKGADGKPCFKLAEFPEALRVMG